jgi:hypothetical protein
MAGGRTTLPAIHLYPHYLPVICSFRSNAFSSLFCCLEFTDTLQPRLKGR